MPEPAASTPAVTATLTPALKSPVAEDVLAVTGHCCSVRLTHLPALADGIDFTPDAAALAVFERCQRSGEAPEGGQGSACPADDPLTASKDKQG